MSNVSIYKDSTDIKGSIATCRNILNYIRDGRWADKVQKARDLYSSDKDAYDQEKRNLPCAIFSGVFSKRSADGILEYSKTIVLDIDKLSQEEINDYKESFKGDGFIYSYFTSPSGFGLKVLVKLKCDQKDHLAAFLALEKHFKQNYAIVIDKSGKDISRLCYVSYDPELYINDEAQPFVFDIEEVSKSINTKRGFDDRPDKFKGHVLSSKADYNFKVCERWTQRTMQYEKGGRNNYIFLLACNANRCGIDQMDAALSIYNSYSDLPLKEIEAAIQSAYRKKSEFNTVDVYDLDKGILPKEEVEMSVCEKNLYDDTIDFLSKGVKASKVCKFIKSYGQSMDMTEEDVMTIFDKAKKKVEDGENPMNGLSAPDALMRAIESYHDNGGVPTGVIEFDEILNGGLMPGLVYGFIGVGGSYKSLFAQCVGSEFASTGGAILYVNSEMSELQLMDRVANKELGVFLQQDLKSKKITIQNALEVVEMLREKIKDKFTVVSGSGYNKKSIINEVNRIEESGCKISLIIIDGLTQMEDTKNDEIKSAIHNSGELKEIAKTTNSAVVALIHTSGNISKHTRDTSKFVRGGSKVTNNLDAMICCSLLIDESSSNMDEGDLMYRQGMFYVRLIDKRGSGLVSSKIIKVNRPLSLEPLSIDPMAMEVKIG